MKKLAIIGMFVTVLQSGCLSKMEQVTTDTKDAVEDTKRGQQLGLALELLFDEEKAIAIRAAAADTVFTLAPDNRIFRYLGCRLPLSFAKDPETRLSNVSRVLRVEEWDARATRAPIYPGVSAPISPSVLAALEDGALSVLKLTLLISKGNPSPEQYAEFRERAVKMIGIATTIFGARSHTKMTEYYRDLVPATLPIIARGTEVEVKSDLLRLRAAELLRNVSVAYSFNESELHELTLVLSERLGVDYKEIDKLIVQMRERLPEYDELSK